jgi:hypothetical protein
MFVYDGRQQLRSWATIPGAHAVLQHISDRLRAQGTSGDAIRSNVDAILAERTPSDADETDEEKEALKKLNAAIDADPRKAEYTDPQKYDPPLTFPVQLYRRGSEVGGQVYYDPNLSSSLPKAGETGGGGKILLDIGPKHSEIQYYSWIRLGPLALGSPELIQSSLYHEALHFRIGLEQKKGAAGDPVARQLGGLDNSTVDAGTGRVTTRAANEDTEVLGIQIRDDAARLSVDEIAGLYWYLAYQLRTGFVLQEFKDRCFDRIASAAAADPAVKTKLISALASSRLDKEDKKQLADLKTKLKAAAAPKPPAAPGKTK